MFSYSCGPSFEACDGESSRGLGTAEGEFIDMGESTEDGQSGVGELISMSALTTNGGLCGNGDISMTSAAGEDEGRKGVAIASSGLIS